MKRDHIITMLPVVVLLIALSRTTAAESQGSGIFMMPVSLEIIEDNAFEHTAPIEVFLREAMTYIGDRAFSQIPSLSAVHIPPSVKYIDKDAFLGSGSLVIVGTPGSFAHDWAERHGYRFVNEAMWIAEKTGNKSGKARSDVARRGMAVGDFDRFRRVCAFARSIRMTDPKGRAEFYPIDYDFP